MKILYCIGNLKSGGGTERVLSTKVNWLVANGQEVTVAVDDRDTSSFFFIDPRAAVVALGASDEKSWIAAVDNLTAYFLPDVCVAVAGRATSLLTRCAKGTPKVLEFHYTRNFLVNFVRGLHHIRFRQLHILKMKWLQWKLARDARRFNRFVGLTKRDVSLWGNPSNMTYIYNPLSFRSDRKADCTATRIIAVGSWTPAKGMDQLLEAYGPLASDFPDWHVDLYGSGQDEGLLRDIVTKYGMESSVTLHAPVRDIHSRLLEGSIYAFPSRSDGFGLVITEAMECGLPTVAMDCECGPREILTPETGITVPDKDIEAFRKALRQLMEDEGLRKRLGANATREVRRFYPNVIMPRWIELFSTLMAAEQH